MGAVSRQGPCLGRVRKASAQAPSAGASDWCAGSSSQEVTEECLALVSTGRHSEEFPPAQEGCPMSGNNSLLSLKKEKRKRKSQNLNVSPSEKQG